MKIIAKNIEIFKKDAYCDKCDNQVSYSGFIIEPVLQTRYRYICLPCNKEYISDIKYPELYYKYVGETERHAFKWDEENG